MPNRIGKNILVFQPDEEIPFKALGWTGGGLYDEHTDKSGGKGKWKPDKAGISYLERYQGEPEVPGNYTGSIAMSWGGITIAKTEMQKPNEQRRRFAYNQGIIYLRVPAAMAAELCQEFNEWGEISP